MQRAREAIGKAARDAFSAGLTPAQLAAQAEHDRKIDALVVAARREGVELSREDVNYALHADLVVAMEEAITVRKAEARRIVKKFAERPKPTWPEVEDWIREDFFRAVEWDQKQGRRGGKRSLARRFNVSPSKLYRLWRAVSPGEPWPSGQKGPSARH